MDARSLHVKYNCTNRYIESLIMFVIEGVEPRVKQTKEKVL